MNAAPRRPWGHGTDRLLPGCPRTRPTDRTAAAHPVRGLRPQQPQPARARRAHGARARRHGRGRGLERCRRSGGRPSPAGADRLPDAQDVHPRDGLATASLPGRASGPARRSRTVVARLGDRARDGRVGRDGARGERRDRRRGRLGHAHLPHARSGEEHPLSPRGPPRGDRRRRRGGHRDRHRPPGRRAARPWGFARHRTPAAADAPARPGDRLERGLDRHGGPPHPRRRGPPGRARHAGRRRVPPVRRPSRRRAAGRPRRAPRTAARGHLPRDRRRRGLDHPPQAPRPLQAARRARPRAGRPRARRAGAGGAGLGAHPPRDRLRGAPRRRLPALRLLQRRDEHRPVPAAARRLPLARAAARRA